MYTLRGKVAQIIKKYGTCTCALVQVHVLSTVRVHKTIHICKLKLLNTLYANLPIRYI